MLAARDPLLWKALAASLLVGACTGGSTSVDGVDDVGPEPTPSSPPRTVVEGPLALDAVVRGDCLIGVVVGAAAPVELHAAGLVSCDRPHDLEVFSTFPLRATDFEAEIGDYPGRARIVRSAEQGCDLRFRESIGSEAELGLLAFWPTRKSWATGDRTVACLVYSLDGKPLRESQLG